MANIFNILLTSASMVIGILLLIASAIALDHYRPGIGSCFNKDDVAWLLVPDTYRTKVCKPFFAIVGVTSIGIVTAVLQILYNLYSLVKRTPGGRSWMGVHGLIFLLTIVSFGVGIHFFGDQKDPYNVFFNVYRDHDKNRLVHAANGIDWIFCIVAIILANLFPGGMTRGDQRYMKPSGV